MTQQIRPSIWERMNEELQRGNKMLHAENALKLKQILDLEQLIYELRVLDTCFDGQPCWCKDTDATFFSGEHETECIKARQVTEPFWKK